MRGEIISREYDRMVFVSDNNGKEFACYAQNGEDFEDRKKVDDKQKELCLDTSHVPGAYLPDPELVGRANFGFVSKYLKKSPVPTGQTQFMFQTADLNFHSDNYKWLIVNKGGDRAQYKGEGTINGLLDENGNLYKFMIWAVDGEPDAFRIKIWSEDEFGIETDVYDNGFDQEINGGQIVIHTKK